MVSRGPRMSEVALVDSIHAWVELESLMEASLAPYIVFVCLMIWVIEFSSSTGKTITLHNCWRDSKYGSCKDEGDEWIGGGPCL